MAGYKPGGHKESDTSEWLSLSFFHFSHSLNTQGPQASNLPESFSMVLKPGSFTRHQFTPLISPLPKTHFQFSTHVSGVTCSSAGKESTCNSGDPNSIPRLGSSPGERIGYPLQYSCLENSMDRGAWRSTVLRVESQTQLKQLSPENRVTLAQISRQRARGWGMPSPRAIVEICSSSQAWSHQLHFEWFNYG